MSNRVIHCKSSETPLPHVSNPKFVKYGIAWDENELQETANDISKKIFELHRSDSNGKFDNWKLIKMCSSVTQAELEAENECQRKLIWG